MDRKLNEKIILEMVQDLDPTGENTKIYQELFKSLNKVEFEEFIEDLKYRRILLSMVFPNNSKTKIEIETLDKLYKKYKLPLQARMIREDITGFRYEAPAEYTLLLLPTRRFKQHQSKAISVAKDSSKRDAITGQVVNASRSGAISNAELPVLTGVGLHVTLDEMFSIRGGDATAATKLYSKIISDGSGSIADIEMYRTGAKSVSATKVLFKAMHLDLNL